jgi:hypothetical protein
MLLSLSVDAGFANQQHLAGESAQVVEATSTCGQRSGESVAIWPESTRRYEAVYGGGKRLGARRRLSVALANPAGGERRDGINR